LGNVYVSDSNSCIQKFDNNGKFITKWGYPEFGFGYPFDVAVDPSNNIYITDYTYNHVWKFDNNGNFLKSWGGFGSKNGVFKGLYGITIDSSGDVYALEGLNVYETGLDNRVQIFTGDGTYINQWKYPGCGHSIAVDSAGNFYIPDSDHNCIEKFAISPFPSGIDIKPVNLEKDTPSVYMDEPITFSYHTDTVAGVDINIHIEETGQDISGKMAGGPTDWTYTTTFSQCYGKATVTYTMSGQQPIVFDIYIDPAGYIYDTDTGQRIEDAFVWLQIPDGNGGWANVTTGKGIMTPDTNPLSTDQNGVYQWDVIPGIYRVHVEANGYEPADSMSVNVQQPITDLNVGLHRNSNGTSVPEFPSIAIPVAAILGLIAINGRRKN
jgi:hypothetical protein